MNFEYFVYMAGCIVILVCCLDIIRTNRQRREIKKSIGELERINKILDAHLRRK